MAAQTRDTHGTKANEILDVIEELYRKLKEIWAVDSKASGD